MQKEGWIIYNGYLQSPAFFDYAQSLHTAAKKRGIKTTLYKNNELLALITTEGFNIIPERLTLPDFVIFTDKDIYLAKQLEQLGIRLFNCANAIEVSDDKIAMYAKLAQHKIRIPKTIIAPKLFTFPDQPDMTYLQSVINMFGFPLIIKEAFGSFGEQVYLVHNQDQLLQTVQKIGSQPFMFQEFIKTSYGKDMRLQVVGRRVAAAMIRSAKDDFRSNVTAGGNMEPYEPTQTEKKLAIAATTAIQADFAGVDLLFGPDDTPIVCEINSNAHIHNLYECTNINVADDIIEHIIQYFSNKE